MRSAFPYAIILAGFIGAELADAHKEAMPYEDRPCYNMVPEELALEEGMAQFDGYLGCGALWNHEPESDIDITPDVRGGELI